MRVTNISVSFERKRQPVQFESSGARVEFTGVIDEGSNEDHIGVAAKLLGDAKNLVLAELALVAAGTNASAHATTAPATSTSPTAESKKPRGKAKDKDNDAPPAQTASAAAAASANETRQISTGEPRIDPAQVEVGAATVAPVQTSGAIDIPAGGAPVVAATPAVVGPTAEELTKWVGDLVKNGKLDSATAKATSRKFGAEKIAQIDASKLAAYKTEIEAAVLRFASASDI